MGGVGRLKFTLRQIYMFMCEEETSQMFFLNERVETRCLQANGPRASALSLVAAAISFPQSFVQTLK